MSEGPAVPEPPDYMIAAAAEAIAAKFVEWNMNIAPAAPTVLARLAIIAARQSVHA
jgi:hypothetical protein